MSIKRRSPIFPLPSTTSPTRRRTQEHYAGWYFPSSNIAGSAITVGAVCLVLDEILWVRRAR